MDELTFLRLLIDLNEKDNNINFSAGLFYCAGAVWVSAESLDFLLSLCLSVVFLLPQYRLQMTTDQL